MKIAAISLANVAILSTAISTANALSLPQWLVDAALSAVHANEDVTVVPEGFTLDLAERRLVQLSHDSEPIWMTEADKLNLIKSQTKFMDITDHQDLGFVNSATASITSEIKYPEISHKDYVSKLNDKLSKRRMKKDLIQFTSYRTRYYRSDTGKQSQAWLLAQVKLIAGASKNIVISEFKHSWGQNSIIAHIKGVSDGPRTIIGAHQDSTNLIPFLPAPGADDDGSGTVTILEAFRNLVKHDFKPETPVEFMWFSAEEGGLLGSQAVAQSYESLGVKVKAMVEMDMTAWVKKGTKEVIGVITDFVNPELTAYNKKLIDAYASIPWVETKCGYACSDFASFTKAGFPASFSIESEFSQSNQLIHSTKDRWDLSEEFSFDHMKEFAKLAVAFAVELGGVAEE